MVMSRTETLVQLNDELVAILDERAGTEGISRSELIRRAIQSYLAEDAQAAIDAAIVASYVAEPPEEPDAATLERAIASIEAEPW
jgi:metal-responsive CopG/Arc/MetJ family transcriptional regulator